MSTYFRSRVVIGHAHLAEFADHRSSTILELPGSENARVAAGDLPFQIDPAPSRSVSAQAEARLNVAEGNSTAPG
jgi:multidrug resistance efflux pump